MSLHKKSTSGQQKNICAIIDTRNQFNNQEVHFLSGKIKIIVLSIVVLAVLSVLFIPQPERFEDEQSLAPGAVSFSVEPNKEPYQDYLAARRDQKPILLEFYARW